MASKESSLRGTPEVPTQQKEAEDQARELYYEPGTVVERSPDLFYEGPIAGSPRGAAPPGSTNASGGSSE